MGSIKFSFSMIWGGALLSMGALLVGTTLVAGETPTPAQRRTVVSGSPQVLTLNDLVSVGHCDWVAQHHSNAALQSAHGQHLAAAHDYLRAIASKNATSIDDARLVLNSAARACSASPSGPAEGGPSKPSASTTSSTSAPAASPVPTAAPKPAAVQTPTAEQKPTPAQKPTPSTEPTHKKPKAEPKVGMTHKPGEAKPGKPSGPGTTPKQ